MKEGSIVLLKLPQADGQLKKRPVLLLKKMHSYGDYLVCGISTQLRQEIKGFDLRLDGSHPDYSLSGLLAPSIIRLGFLSVVNDSKIPGAIGSISPQTLKLLCLNLGAFISGN